MSEAGFKPGVLRALVNAGYGDHLSRLRVTPTERSREVAAYVIRCAALLPPARPHTLAVDLHERMKSIARDMPLVIGEPATVANALASVLLLTSGRVPSVSTIKRALTSPLVNAPPA